MKQQRARPAPPKTAHAQAAHQVRIIGGQWKRTPLPVISAPGLRPTPDRVRETLFNWLNHLRGGAWAEMRCLDLFAGSGALGFEAASRGAQEVTMIESHAPAVARLEAVKAKLNAGQVHILRTDALAALRSMAARGQSFDLIFLDPPYGQGWLEKALPLCEVLIEPNGMVYAESDYELEPSHDGRTAVASQLPTVLPDWLRNWEVIRSDKAGIINFQLLQRKSPPDFQA